MDEPISNENPTAYMISICNGSVNRLLIKYKYANMSQKG